MIKTKYFQLYALQRQYAVLTALSIATFAFSDGQASAEGFARKTAEIHVSADAWAWVAPDTVRLEFEVIEEAATGASAIAALTERTSLLKAQIAKTSAHAASVEELGDTFTGTTPSQTGLQPGAPLRVTRALGITVKRDAKLGEIIDAILDSGVSQLDTVNYLVRDGQQKLDTAIEIALGRARNKASLVAKKYGVNLGPALRVEISEEPQGRLQRRMRQVGVEPLDRSDQEVHVFVNVSFATIPAKITGN